VGNQNAPRSGDGLRVAATERVAVTVSHQTTRERRRRTEPWWFL